MGMPPVGQWCALTEPQIIMDFGTLVMNSANTATNTQIECTTGMKYTLRLVGLEKIPLANGMQASLTADSKALGSTLDGSEGVKSTPSPWRRHSLVSLTLAPLLVPGYSSSATPKLSTSLIIQYSSR